MKIILQEVKSIYEVLNKFSDQKLPIKLSYKLMKILTQLEPELEFYRDQMRGIITECAELDEKGQIVYVDNGESIKLKADKTEEFSNRYNDLSNMEVEVDDFSFSLDELENLELSPKELYALNPYIIE